MSDVLSDVNMYLSEPDETVLTAALRNKDDIPILMDIVGDETPPISQEEHLQSSIGIDPEVRPVTATGGSPKKKTAHAPMMPAAHNTQGTHAKPNNVATQTEQPAQVQTRATHDAQPAQPIPTPASEEAATTSVMQEDERAAMLADVIQAVLERKLPEIVNDVMLEIAKREQQ